MSHQQNIVRIKAVHQTLGDLCNRVLFVGGATVSLYTDRPTGEVRPTDDVDILEHLPSTALKTRLFGDWKSAKKLRIRFDGTPARQVFQAILKIELIIRKYEMVLVRPTPLQKNRNPCRY